MIRPKLNWSCNGSLEQLFRLCCIGLKWKLKVAFWISNGAWVRRELLTEPSIRIFSSAPSSACQLEGVVFLYPVSICRAVYKDVFRCIWGKVYSWTSQKGYYGNKGLNPAFFIAMASLTFRWIIYNLQNTLREYGGRDLVSSVTNVAFVHGSLDPWHALGITHSTNQLSPAILIPGTSHCANLYPETKDDSKALIEARTMVGQLIGQWIGQAYRLQ